MQAGKEIQLLEDARPGAIGPKVYGADFKRGHLLEKAPVCEPPISSDTAQRS
jgi:hypothetical protein